MNNAETVTPEDNLTAESLLESITSVYPGAQRTLFRHYHIGGCKSCAFSPSESLEELCSRNQLTNPADVLQKIRESHSEDAAFFISPEELKSLIESGGELKMLDIRTADEFDAVKIPGAILMSQPVMQDIMAYWNPEHPLVIIDHQGHQALDAAAYFSGHGLKNVRCLQGGIDAYAKNVDASLPRYTIE